MAVEDALTLLEGLDLHEVGDVLLEELLVRLDVAEQLLVRVLLGRKGHVERILRALAYEPERQAQREERGGVCRVVPKPAAVQSTSYEGLVGGVGVQRLAGCVAVWVQRVKGGNDFDRGRLWARLQIEIEGVLRVVCFETVSPAVVELRLAHRRVVSGVVPCDPNVLPFIACPALYPLVRGGYKLCGLLVDLNEQVQLQPVLDRFGETSRRIDRELVELRTELCLAKELDGDQVLSNVCAVCRLDEPPVRLPPVDALHLCAERELRQLDAFGKQLPEYQLADGGGLKLLAAPDFHDLVLVHCG